MNHENIKITRKGNFVDDKIKKLKKKENKVGKRELNQKKGKQDIRQGGRPGSLVGSRNGSDSREDIRQGGRPHAGFSLRRFRRTFIENLTSITVRQLLSAIMSLLVVLRMKIAGPTKRRSGGGIMMYVLLAGLFSGIIVAEMSRYVERNGTEWYMHNKATILGYPKSGLTNLTSGEEVKLPHDVCDEGLGVSKICPKVPKEFFPEVGCASTKEPFNLTYTRCKPRTKRSVKKEEPSKTDFSVSGVVKKVEKDIKSFVGTYRFLSGALLLAIIMMINPRAIMVVTIILAAYMVGLSSAEVIQENQVVSGGDRSIITLTATSGRIYDIESQKTNFTIQMVVLSSNITSKVGLRELYQTCEQTATKSENGCPGGKTVMSSEYLGGEKICKVHTVATKWGDCVLFGTGHVRTCLEIQCGDPVKISRYYPEAITHKVKFVIGGVERTLTLGDNSHSVVDLGTPGIMNIKCSLKDKWLNGYLHVKNGDEEFLDMEEHVDNWKGPFKVPSGELQGLDRILKTEDVKFDEVTYKIMIPTYTKSGQEVLSSSGQYPAQHLNCKLNMARIIPTLHQDECRISSFIKTDESTPYAGMKFMSVLVGVGNPPCMLIMDCQGGTCVGNTWTIGQSEITLRVVIHLADGRNAISAGGFTLEFDHERSYIVDFIQKTTKVITVKGMEMDSFGYDFTKIITLMAQMSTKVILALVGVLMVVSLPGPYKMLGVVLLLGVAVKGDFACGYDSDEGLFCGNGIMIRDETRVTKGSFRVKSGSLIKQVIERLLQQYLKINVACSSVAECLAMGEVIKQMGSSYEVSIKPPMLEYKRFEGNAVLQVEEGKTITMVFGKMRKSKTEKMKITLIPTTLAENLENVVWFPVSVVGVVSRIYGNIVVMDSDNTLDTLDGFCRMHKFATGMKNTKYRLTDESMVFDGENGKLKYARIAQIIHCIRPDTVILGERRADSYLIIPRGIGGPPTVFNTMPTYGQQKRWPLEKAPYTVEIGFCPGIKVFNNGTDRLASVLKVIKDTQKVWCCKGCDNSTGIHLMDGEQQCWMPQETYPCYEEENHGGEKTSKILKDDTSGEAQKVFTILQGFHQGPARSGH